MNSAEKLCQLEKFGPLCRRKNLRVNGKSEDMKCTRDVGGRRRMLH